MASNLKASLKQILELVQCRKLVLSYVPEAENALRAIGGNFTELLNILRNGDAQEIATGFQFKGILDNGTPIVVFARPFHDICDKPKEVRIGLFVSEIVRGEGRRNKPKRSA